MPLAPPNQPKNGDEDGEAEDEDPEEPDPEDPDEEEPEDCASTIPAPVPSTKAAAVPALTQFFNACPT